MHEELSKTVVEKSKDVPVEGQMEAKGTLYFVVCAYKMTAIYHNSCGDDLGFLPLFSDWLLQCRFCGLCFKILSLNDQIFLLIYLKLVRDHIDQCLISNDFLKILLDRLR